MYKSLTVDTKTLCSNLEKPIVDQDQFDQWRSCQSPSLVVTHLSDFKHSRT